MEREVELVDFVGDEGLVNDWVRVIRLELIRGD